VKTKKSKINASNANLSTDILDIMDKPDVAVWNKTVRKRDFGVKRLNIGTLDQNLIREDKRADCYPLNLPVTALRTALENREGVSDKDATSHDDLLIDFEC
jgi:hypothetical protein